MQLQSNFKQGGIIGFDIDNIEADMPAEDGESHQLILDRKLSDDEIAMIDFLNGEDGCYEEEEDSIEIDGKLQSRQWLSIGPLSLQCRAYLLALKA